MTMEYDKAAVGEALIELGKVIIEGTVHARAAWPDISRSLQRFECRDFGLLLPHEDASNRAALKQGRTTMLQGRYAVRENEGIMIEHRMNELLTLVFWWMDEYASVPIPDVAVAPLALDGNRCTDPADGVQNTPTRNDCAQFPMTVLDNRSTQILFPHVWRAIQAVVGEFFPLAREQYFALPPNERKSHIYPSLFTLDDWIHWTRRRLNE